MFLQSNPIPVKAALALMGHCENTLRSPLMPMQGAALEGLRDILRKQGLVD
jgi:4-hydroxy-tetrahydrodipicolinate synthase